MNLPCEKTLLIVIILSLILFILGCILFHRMKNQEEDCGCDKKD